MAKEPHPSSASAGARAALQQAGVSLSITGTTAQQRLQKRQQQRLLRQQKNLESILAKGLRLIENTATDTPLDADWLDNFLELAEKSANTDMQALWASIFAKEASSSGSFSIRSLRTLSEMTRKDAQLFQQAVALHSRTPGDRSCKILFGCHYLSRGFFGDAESHNLNLNQYGLPYSSILWLMEHGLLFSSDLETSPLNPKQDYQIRLTGDLHSFTPSVKKLKLRYYRFTPVGDELAPLIGNLKHEAYHDALLAMLGQVMKAATPPK
ncbi:TIGR03899 family protein [Neiella marina]|uniref:TIGR03899 family protein n=1 Tax=Neiella holothuriorum TaxID=2870530 RepID=A0ABS7EFF3_9GAMM|nr:TIGR03899 family protein [Neiella holothuriorum]MBW8191082.1 TIGR03899 family protein [Neiella holothuriorum]